jgi:hypothetical protein
VSVRDLEADGSMSKAASVGSGELSLFMAVINAQAEIKILQNEVKKLKEGQRKLLSAVAAETSGTSYTNEGVDQ